MSGRNVALETGSGLRERHPWTLPWWKVEDESNTWTLVYHRHRPHSRSHRNRAVPDSWMENVFVESEPRERGCAGDDCGVPPRTCPSCRETQSGRRTSAHLSQRCSMVRARRTRGSRTIEITMRRPIRSKMCPAPVMAGSGGPISDGCRLGPLQLTAWEENWHGNHHMYPASARFSRRWWQVDVGWYVIVVLRATGLARNIRVNKGR